VESNEGAALLKARGGSRGALVALLGAAGVHAVRATVGNWRDARTKPGPEARAVMAKPPLKIPPDAWDRTAGDVVGPANRAAAPPTPPILPPALREAKREAIPPAEETAADLAQGLLTRIQILREQFETTSLGIPARKQLAEMEGAAIERYAKLTGQSATPESQLLRSPAWAKLSAKVLDALEAYPDALRAVREALR
jgi:hypothetical protein